MIMKFCLWLLLSLTLLAPLQANEAVPMAEDPVLEARLVQLSDNLRCLVCQNESLSGSHADLAKDLRREIRGLMKAGKSDAEILDFMVARYGDFVLYRPPVKPTTWLLWGGPFVLLVAAIFLLLNLLRRRAVALRDSPPPEQLSEAERLRARSLLDGESSAKKDVLS
ncbi:MAG: cytochrome c-type biogenesis protein CcmH [Rhodocyclaceae bacterium]|nr:cytochrome c-type biogenesis protein CcmH [Rhodocyclaceae bacterium]MBP6278498.1 cytochrome c-type biogenesis protein CcmH [Rhodocyclaceae bacterium]